jgi:hypothetical protein
MAERPIALPPVPLGGAPCSRTSAKKSASAFAVRRNARGCLKPPLTASAISDYLEMEQRWLALARSYEFAERLSNFTEPFRNRKQPKENDRQQDHRACESR